MQSLRTLLEHLGTRTPNRVTLTQYDPHEFELLARMTSLQAAVFALLGVDPSTNCFQKTDTLNSRNGAYPTSIEWISHRLTK